MFQINISVVLSILGQFCRGYVLTWEGTFIRESILLMLRPCTQTKLVFIVFMQQQGDYSRLGVLLPKGYCNYGCLALIFSLNYSKGQPAIYQILSKKRSRTDEEKRAMAVKIEASCRRFNNNNGSLSIDEFYNVIKLQNGVEVSKVGQHWFCSFQFCNRHQDNWLNI